MSTIDDWEAKQAIYDLGLKAGRREVGAAIADWAAKNEIAAPPLDWAWLGEIVRWTGTLAHEANVGDCAPNCARVEETP